MNSTVDHDESQHGYDMAERGLRVPLAITGPDSGSRTDFVPAAVSGFVETAIGINTSTFPPALGVGMDAGSSPA
jgi:hypothetical protein